MAYSETMNRIFLLTACLLVSLSASATEDNKAFAVKLFEMVRAGDFAAYSKIIHPSCKLSSTSEKAFKLRSNVLSGLKKGYRVDAISMDQYKQIKEKQDYPFVDSYSIEPSFYAVVWKTSDSRVDLNPVMKKGDEYLILDGSCISAIRK